MLLEDKFLDYLLKGRGLDPRTARDYLNYLKKLTGQKLDYDLYLKISSSRWMVKTVRLYIDYLRKTGRLADGEAGRLLKLFKLK